MIFGKHLIDQTDRSAYGDTDRIDINNRTDAIHELIVGYRGPRMAREDDTGARRMPWRREPTKGAESRDSPRGGAHGLRSGGARMGEPAARWRRIPALNP